MTTLPGPSQDVPVIHELTPDLRAFWAGQLAELHAEWRPAILRLLEERYGQEAAGFLRKVAHP